MAKKVPAPKPATGSSRQLIDAIAAVKQIQDFIKEHGNAEKALAAAVRVQGLIQLTGGFEALKEALEIVGKDDSPAQA